MTISIIIIAHNEEQGIECCIKSALGQTRKPDEIIVVAHNCTDQTVVIAQKYSVKIVECTGDGGPIYARMRGISEAIGEIIACTDGDAWVDAKWLAELTKPLFRDNKVSIVAGYTIVQNSIFWRLSCWFQFCIMRWLLDVRVHRFGWGSNMAFRKADYVQVGGFEKYIAVYQARGVKLYAEDLYISLALQKLGRMKTALRALVYTYLPRDKASIVAQRRIVPIQRRDNAIIRTMLRHE